MLKTSFKQEESKQFFYCGYKNFDKEHFQMDLESELSNCPKKYENFKTTFENFLNAHVVTLNRKSKIQYFDNIQKFKNSKPF